MGVERGPTLAFPGQNSVEAGMGKRLHDSYPVAREVYKIADHTLGFGITEICIDGTIEDLQPSNIAQPALVATSCAWLEVLKTTRQDLLHRPSAIISHSTGEYSGLVATGSLSLEDALLVSHARGQFLDEEAEKNPASMIAFIGLNQEEVEQICSLSGSEIANINSDRQIVLAGTKPAIAKAVQIARELKAKIVDLGIGVGSHFSGAEPVAKKLALVLQNVDVSAPKIPFVANATTDYVKTASQVKDALVRQLTNRVRWLDMVIKMIQDGNIKFCEIGPRDTLTRLIRRIAKDRLLTVEAFSTADILAQSKSNFSNRI